MGESDMCNSIHGRGNRCVWLVALVLLLASISLAASANSSEVLEAERQRQAALIAGDPALLEAILADDLTYTHSQGRVQTKAGLIASLGSGRVRYRSIEVEEPTPRMLGEAAAIVSSPASMVVEAAGKTMNLRSRFLAVYARRDGEWKLVAYQSTSLGSAERSQSR